MYLHFAGNKTKEEMAAVISQEGDHSTNGVSLRRPPMSPRKKSYLAVEHQEGLLSAMMGYISGLFKKQKLMLGKQVSTFKYSCHWTDIQIFLNLNFESEI